MNLKLIVLAMLISITGLNSKAQTINFSGDWKINLAKSQLNDSEGFTKAYKVIQKGNDLILNWTTAYPDGKDVNWSEKVIIGKEASASFLEERGRTRLMSASFSKDGKSMLIDKCLSKKEKQTEIDNLYRLNERWSLSADGKELLIEMTTPANPALITKAFYSRNQ